MVQVRPFPRDDVRMHMRHTLPRLRPVLHSDIQTRRAVHALNHPSDPLHGKEEIARFGGGQVRNAGNAPARGNEDVAREDGFEVYKGEGEWDGRDLYLGGDEEWAEVDLGAFEGGGHGGDGVSDGHESLFLIFWYRLENALIRD
ncbi:hypothetical protein KXW98_005888 [Aspergillus fumigatus]|nr:hypothetical protein CNMCM8057_002138 [Aspergillus fumigatus]KAF4287157.1 hypothetical protein CNMCM8689_000648 [Aspergillus fumigatus]KAH3484862.1 hypothetical protein KXW98_005888 [Aspergillus fumigatus]